MKGWLIILCCIGRGREKKIINNNKTLNVQKYTKVHGRRTYLKKKKGKIQIKNLNFQLDWQFYSSKESYLCHIFPHSSLVHRHTWNCQHHRRMFLCFGRLILRSHQYLFANGLLKLSYRIHQIFYLNYTFKILCWRKK